MADQQEQKRLAAEQAVARVSSGMILGLGSGSTAAVAVGLIGYKLRTGEIENIAGIPTSNQTRDLAQSHGIPLTTLEERPIVDLTIDGADEVDPAGNLVKGGGGALLWEKIVAAASRRYIIIVDKSKLVDRLGSGCAVPVEVMPFGWTTHLHAVRELGGEPNLRTDAEGKPWVTDGGHYILDCRFSGGLSDPVQVDRELRKRPGVVETGLFIGMSPEVIVGRAVRA
ncbi:MAG: ribose-5-phosphate isomerase RpiA [Gemmatimonadales bacterium]|nr:ribose-5-phosphate isomerase RpiA [Gemmatimonadales bacterium]NIN13367.1 ribose-5-phosphate isomerase RpiA [Gemmatimonadales bacterium]NIN51370.1 ribose-5-phosphate isomerase RpiA [Gemmatimonadales bacterium]NIP08834.1 ribose-5-phosphate isomerase RpiA [Gemmatimonadales bacterium]NIQ99828.1 ribose-5-phosphate isomerase RpiA [Gemmatimonadales bacterium]